MIPKECSHWKLPDEIVLIDVINVEYKMSSQLIVATKSSPSIQSKKSKQSSDTSLSCQHCGRHFVSLGKLKSHEKTHSKSRPFKCIDCNKTFTVRYSLICHTRTHTRERPYQCSLCGSRFTQASSLKTHVIYKHTKQFPYLCKLCGRGFISPGQKAEHVHRSHNKQTSKRTSTVKTTEMVSTQSQTALSLPPNLF